MKKVKNVIDRVDKTALVHDYQDACSNKEFKDYVDSLNINDDILMKYTSSLEESFCEEKNCSKCKSITTCKNNIVGYKYTPEKDNNIITFSYIACPKKQKEIKNNLYKENVELYDMPKEISEASFKNVYKDDSARLPILKYFNEFMKNYSKVDKPKGLYLNGSFGSGKTYLIAALFNEMAKKDIKSVLVYYPEFLRSLKASFSSDFDELYNDVKCADLLLLDDIGAENVTPWSRDEILGPIIQYRMEEGLPTFFTSNLTLEELEMHLSMESKKIEKLKAKRLIEKISYMCDEIKLISKNNRK